MHRSELETLVPCADCGATIDPAAGRGYSFGAAGLCFDCALARGGRYDAEQDRWVDAPRVADLAEPER